MLLMFLWIENLLDIRDMENGSPSRLRQFLQSFRIAVILIVWRSFFTLQKCIKNLRLVKL